MDKKTGYRIFAAAYRFFTVWPVGRDRVFSVMTHDPSETGNVRVMERYLETKNSEGRQFTFTHLTRGERDSIGAGAGTASHEGRLRSRISFIIRNAYNMARAQYILMDNVFLPMAFFKVRKQTKVIQFWHGTGTIKKFGQDSNEGELKELEYRHNQNIDALIVNSKYIAPRYAGAFGIDIAKVYPLGLPVTDMRTAAAGCKEAEKTAEGAKTAGPGSNEDGYEEAVRKLGKFAGRDLTGKKLILYAPTFRDTETKEPKLHLGTERLLGALSDDCVLLARLHPFVSANCRIEDGERLINVTSYPDLNELFDASDCLITDYSSVIFDYCLTDKPMYFYADDLAEFSDHGRGFYEPYEEFVPGPVAESEEQLGEMIMNNSFEKYVNKKREFTDRFYDHKDGKACEKVYNTVF